VGRTPTRHPAIRDASRTAQTDALLGSSAECMSAHRRWNRQMTFGSILE